MKSIALLTAAVLFATASIFFAAGDENHEIIEKVMKNGMKGEESPFAKTVGGESSKEEKEALANLIKTLDGTKAPVGEQEAYDKKVDELIAAMEAVAGGETGDKAIGRLEEAGNCKSCHSKHKPKKE